MLAWIVKRTPCPPLSTLPVIANLKKKNIKKLPINVRFHKLLQGSINDPFISVEEYGLAIVTVRCRSYQQPRCRSCYIDNIQHSETARYIYPGILRISYLVRCSVLHFGTALFAAFFSRDFLRL